MVAAKREGQVERNTIENEERGEHLFNFTLVETDDSDKCVIVDVNFSSSRDRKMDPDVDLLTKYLKRTYVDQALQGIRSRQFLINQLLEKSKWPEEGWDELTIQMFLQMLSGMDSNNFLSNIPAGEREGKIASGIVDRRCFKLSHGIGRSGDLTEVQPKAAGSSIMNQLCNKLALDVLRTCGVQNTKACFVAPLATGMSLTLCFLTLRQQRPDAKYIIWPRIDQKSCFKCIKTAGFEPLIVENTSVGDVLRTDLNKIDALITEYGHDKISCVFSTTSCFAPRVPDDVVGISKLCANHNVPHVINNAYGVQLSRCMHVIEEASRKGRVDCFVQSTDKNFMVPVGGSIIAGFDQQFISEVSSNYPGRGSASPSLDLLITFLSLGSNGYKKLLCERKENFFYLKSKLEATVKTLNERILETKDNTISIGVTLDNLDQNNVTMLGSMLFVRGISGARVIASDDKVKEINGYKFTNWSSHSNCYPHSYLTIAAAIGGSKSDIDKCISKIVDCITSLTRSEKDVDGGDENK